MHVAREDQLLLNSFTDCPGMFLGSVRIRGRFPSTALRRVDCVLTAAYRSTLTRRRETGDTDRRETQTDGRRMEAERVERPVEPGLWLSGDRLRSCTAGREGEQEKGRNKMSGKGWGEVEGKEGEK